MKLISIIMPYYKKRAFVEEAINSVLCQTYKKFELILIYDDEDLDDYKYIFNPLGTGKFINLRFYEAVKLGCIPVQQVTEDMVNWYNELSKGFMFFEVNQISFDKLQKFESLSKEFYLEDYFESINLQTFLS